MDFDFTAEQLMLRDQARKLLTRRAGCERLRQLHARRETLDRDLWREIAELGWLGIAAPEDYGGIGLGGGEICVIAECAGATLPAVPLLESLLATEAIRLGASDAQRARYLRPLCTGELIGTVVLSGVADVTIGGIGLSGTAVPIPYGLQADIAIVHAVDANGAPKLHIVDLRERGCERVAVATIDPYVPHARITLTDAPAEPLAAMIDGRLLARVIEDRAAVITAFAQLGAAEACLKMARDYAMQRMVFARPIGSFQAVKHRLAEMLVRNEIARSNAYFGAWALDASYALATGAAAARLSAIDAAEFAARENLHLHGGMGYTEEADCHFYLRRSRTWALALGGEAEWAERLISNHIADARTAQEN